MSAEAPLPHKIPIKEIQPKLITIKKRDQSNTKQSKNNCYLQKQNNKSLPPGEYNPEYNYRNKYTDDLLQANTHNYKNYTRELQSANRSEMFNQIIKEKFGCQNFAPIDTKKYLQIYNTINFKQKAQKSSNIHFYDDMDNKTQDVIGSNKILSNNLVFDKRAFQFGTDPKKRLLPTGFKEKRVFSTSSNSNRLIDFDIISLNTQINNKKPVSRKDYDQTNKSQHNLPYNEQSLILGNMMMQKNSRKIKFKENFLSLKNSADFINTKQTSNTDRKNNVLLDQVIPKKPYQKSTTNFENKVKMNLKSLQNPSETSATKTLSESINKDNDLIFKESANGFRINSKKQLFKKVYNTSRVNQINITENPDKVINFNNTDNIFENSPPTKEVNSPIRTIKDYRTSQISKQINPVRLKRSFDQTFVRNTSKEKSKDSKREYHIALYQKEKGDNIFKTYQKSPKKENLFKESLLTTIHGIKFPKALERAQTASRQMNIRKLGKDGSDSKNFEGDFLIKSLFEN